jgi:hypothetical protein
VAKANVLGLDVLVQTASNHDPCEVERSSGRFDRRWRELQRTSSTQRADESSRSDPIRNVESRHAVRGLVRVEGDLETRASTTAGGGARKQTHLLEAESSSGRLELLAGLFVELEAVFKRWSAFSDLAK